MKLLPALAVLGAAGGAAAQTPPEIPHVVSPLQVESDHNGVNLVDGKITIDVPVLAVPGAPHLRFDRIQNAAPYVSGRILPGAPDQSRVESYSIHAGGAASESFRCVDYDCISVTETGSTFVPNSNV